MSARVVILQGADADLRELRRYVARRFGKSTCAGTLRSIRAAVDRVREHPDPGHVPDELVALSLLQCREMLAGANRIVYERRGKVAYVQLICDSRRDLKNVLPRRLVEAG